MNIPRMLVLLTIWCLLQNSVALGVVLVGVLLVLAIELAMPATLTARRIPVLKLLRFVVLVLWDMWIATWQMVPKVIGSPRNLKPGFIKVPLRLSSDQARAMLAATISLTPGTVSVQVIADDQGAYLWLHVLDLANETALVHTINQRYQQPLVEIFGS